MLGQKLSIVTRKAQTTRHKLLGILSEPDYQMILFDTPGIIQVMVPAVPADVACMFTSRVFRQFFAPTVIPLDELMIMM